MSNKINFLIAIAIFVCSAISAQNCDQHKALIEKMEQSMEKKDPTLLADIYHNDAVRHTPNGSEEGLAKIQEGAAEFYKNVPDSMGENLDFICTDDYLVVRWKGTGTPVGAPQKVNVTGITISKVADNKIVEEWEEMGMLSLMMQLGYELTPPAGAGDGK